LVVPRTRESPKTLPRPRVLKTSYRDEPRPEYAPKKNSVNNPRAASPPTVATIQRGTLPISLILIKFF
jgi:hypothetical protein